LELPTVSIESVDDNLYPKVCEGCKRAMFKYRLRIVTSQSVDEGDENDNAGTMTSSASTIELESFYDPKPSKLPRFLVNNMNKQWGPEYLHKLVRLCYQKLGWSDYNDTSTYHGYNLWGWRICFDLKKALNNVFHLNTAP